MSSTYTRQYLQNLPRESRKEWIKSIYLDHYHGKNVISHVIEAAKEGSTSVAVPMIDYFSRYKVSSHEQKLPSWMKNPITSLEVICILQEIFPDSKITYEEEWMQISPNIKEHKQNFRVDWS
jgi:hypothetical protein